KRRASGTTGRLPWAVAGVLGVAAFAGAVVTLQHLLETPPDVRPLRFTIAQPEDTTLTGRIGNQLLSTTPQFAVSPDARYVVLVALSQRVPSLWLRSLDPLEIRRISGTEQASYPFWSPDSRFIAFFAEDKLLKIPIDGGPPIVVCQAAGGIGLGGTWNRDDVI